MNKQLQLRQNLHFFGPQGSGKGTQAAMLAEKLNFKLISAGKLFRSRSRKNDEFAIHLKKVLDEGLLVPVGIFERVLEEAIIEAKDALGFIFDGAMRNLEQVEILATIWSKLDLADPWIIYLKLSDNEAIKRIGNRLTCDHCGFITSVNFHQQIPAICPKCQIGHFIKRSDDTLEAVKERLQIFHQETKVVINYFQKLNRVIEIDGSPAIKEVQSLISQALAQPKIF